MAKTCSYGFGRTFDLPFAAVVDRTRKALKEEGFGILTEIDVQDKFKEKLGRDFRPYLILGACNPSLAHQALTAEVNLGLLLPCNVIVYGEEDGGATVMAMDPVSVLSVVDNPAMAEVAGQVRENLSRAMAKLERQ